MNTNFELFFKIILGNECGSGNGYVNDKDDRGGETIYGITRRNHPELKIWKSIDQLPTVKEKKAYRANKEEMEEVKMVYYRKYYRKLQCDYFNDDCLSLQLFDMGVNAGISTAAKLLQEVLGITKDGIVGEQTVHTANVQKRVCEKYKEMRKKYYITIAKKGNNAKYLKGWLRRVDKTKI